LDAQLYAAFVGAGATAFEDFVILFSHSSCVCCLVVGFGVLKKNVLRAGRRRSPR
jgi:hypothetical protein